MESLFGECFGDDFGVGPRGGHHLPVLARGDLAGTAACSGAPCGAGDGLALDSLALGSGFGAGGAARLFRLSKGRLASGEGAASPDCSVTFR